MQREVPGDPGAGTSSYWVMPSNTATKISTIFRDRVITEFIYLLISAAMVSMMFRRLIWIHFFYHFLSIRLYHEFLSQLNCHFDIAFFETLLTSDNNSSKTSQWNIMKFYLPTLKHLVIQLAKLQIYTLNLTTTFWHCKKKSHYFWTGVYILYLVIPVTILKLFYYGTNDVFSFVLSLLSRKSIAIMSLLWTKIVD